MAAPRPLTPLPLPLPQLYDHFQNEARRSDEKQAAPRQRARRAPAVVFAPKLLLASGVVPIPDQLLSLPRSAGQASRPGQGQHGPSQPPPSLPPPTQQEQDERQQLSTSTCHSSITSDPEGTPCRSPSELLPQPAQRPARPPTGAVWANSLRSLTGYDSGRKEVAELVSHKPRRLLRGGAGTVEGLFAALPPSPAEAVAVVALLAKKIGVSALVFSPGSALMHL